MRIENHTTYPSPEVERIIRQGMGAGPLPGRVVVSYRTSATDNRQGFTPFDNAQPTTIHLDRASAYPQTGAKSWHDELITTAGHEVWHFRNPHAPCVRDACEISAERHGQSKRRLLVGAIPAGSMRNMVRSAPSGGTLGWLRLRPHARTTPMPKEHPNKKHKHLVRGHLKACPVRGGHSRSKRRRSRGRDSFGRFK